MKRDKDYPGVQRMLEDDYRVTVGIEHLPSMQEFEIWKNWICWEDGVDPQGRFNGFCPFHDGGRVDDVGSFLSFAKGMFWCNHEPSCLEQRCTSLTNVYERLARSKLA